MSDLSLKTSLSMDEIEENFKNVDFFAGVMDGLQDALAHKKPSQLQNSKSLGEGKTTPAPTVKKANAPDST